jgi:GTP cyclohydrolase I
MKEINKDQIEQAVRQILEAIGEDPNREGLLDTPKRVAKMYAEVFCGLERRSERAFQNDFRRGP